MEAIKRSIIPNVSNELLRTRPVLPVKETAVRHTFKLKLQRQNSVKFSCRLESFHASDSGRRRDLHSDQEDCKCADTAYREQDAE
eukprot:6084078-Pleurochrysis_carterae.AAC.1